jgi:hypothetical protein
VKAINGEDAPYFLLPVVGLLARVIESFVGELSAVLKSPSFVKQSAFLEM